MKPVDYRSPRCYLVYANAPEGTTLEAANAAFNTYCAAPGRGVALFHDHVRELPGGGVGVFYVDGPAQLAALEAAPELAGWAVRVHALIHARSPGGFDEQIAYTVRHYAGGDWDALRQLERPTFG